MVALKDRSAEAHLQKPGGDYPITVIFGPDSGLVRENVEKLIKNCGILPDDAFALIRIDGDLIADDPARLMDEAQTIPLFGGDRVIWLRPASKASADKAISGNLAILADSPPPSTRLIVEAGDLKKTSALRQIAENHRKIAAIACYADRDRDLDAIIDQELRVAGLGIDNDARILLKSLLGGDRQASRGEIIKLVLYAHGQSRITLDDIENSVGDVSVTLLQDIIDATLGGNPELLENILPKALTTGLDATMIMGQVARQLMLIRKARTLMETGGSASGVVDRLGQPLFGDRKTRMIRQIEKFTPQMIDTAANRLLEAMITSRGNSAVGDMVAARTLLSLSMTARAAR